MITFFKYYLSNLACVFSCKFVAYFQDTFFQEHLWTAAFEDHYLLILTPALALWTINKEETNYVQ